jgi:hypothetical protein
MVDLAHQQMHLLLALLALGNVLDGADDGGRGLLAPGVLEISKPMQLDPADLAVCQPNPVLDRVGLRHAPLTSDDGITRRLAGRPKPVQVGRMHFSSRSMTAHALQHSRDSTISLARIHCKRPPPAAAPVWRRPVSGSPDGEPAATMRGNDQAVLFLAKLPNREIDGSQAAGADKPRARRCLLPILRCRAVREVVYLASQAK